MEEEVCDIRKKKVNSAGYRQKKGSATERPWGRGCISSVVLVELERMAEFHTLSKEEIAELSLPKT